MENLQGSKNKPTNEILVATDGSEAGVSAAQYAVNMAEKLEMGVVAIGVINVNKYESMAQTFSGGMGWLSVKEKFIKEREKEVTNDLNAVRKICEEKRVQGKGIIGYGYPDEEIIKYAKEHESVRMIVIGGSGKDFLGRKILGSVAEKIVQGVTRTLPCPVVVVPCKICMSDARLSF
jgi:nucleotide-binding universal stress UspA family protein